MRYLESTAYYRDLKSMVERAGMVCGETGYISYKHFFSGAAACVNGKIFMTNTPVGLALKLREDDRNTLFDQGGKPLQYFSEAPVKKDYAVLPLELISDDGDLSHWITRSIEFSRSEN